MLGYGVLGSCARIGSGAAKAQITTTTSEATAENAFRPIGSSRNAMDDKNPGAEMRQGGEIS